MENISTTIKPSIQKKYSGTITVSKIKGKSDRLRYYASNMEWFNDAEYFVFNENEHGFTIKKCLCIEIPKNAIKFNLRTQKESDVPEGKYEIDEEESTIDELVIYYNTED
jgi:hypothetical protein